MRMRWVIGNWKMHGSFSTIDQLLKETLAGLPEVPSCSVAVAPPAVYLPYVREKLLGSPIKWGAQNVYPEAQGAYTGEISGPMLKETGCHFVLVGHSERRMLFSESSAFVAQKFCHVKEQGMIPVLCIGETKEAREKGLTEQILSEQLTSVISLCKTGLSECIIAYEPVWAIGTGQAATPEQAQEVHAFIRKFMAENSQEEADTLPILYGGSVNAQNASELFALPDVDGVLVGGASLESSRFLDIIKCIK